MGRNKGTRVVVYFGDDLFAAMTAHVKETGQQPSTLIRTVLAQHLGQPEAAAVIVGRPRKDAAAPPSPRKKAVAATGKVVSAPKKATKRKTAAD